MNPEDMKFCQSCGMPMSDEHFASEKDGSKSEDYCKYCYLDGEFTSDITMEEMIDYSAPKAAEVTGMSVCGNVSKTKTLDEIILNFSFFK